MRVTCMAESTIDMPNQPFMDIMSLRLLAT